MSTPSSGPRRRRIAGERRHDNSAEPAPEGQAPPEHVPVSLSKDLPPAGPTSDAGGPESRGEAPPPPGRSGTPVLALCLVGGAAVVALALLLVLVLTPLVGGGFQAQRDADAVATAETDATGAAEHAAETVLAYDYIRLDQDKAAATALMTPAFAAKYTKTFDSAVSESAKEFSAKVTSKVRGSGVLRGSAEKVKVLLFVDQTTVSTAHSDPQLALNRVEFVMVERDGKWLVDDISSY